MGRLRHARQGDDAKEAAEISVVAGQIIVAATGNFSTYGIDDFFKALQPFQFGEEVDRYFETDGKGYSSSQWGWENRFWAWMIRRGLVEPTTNEVVLINPWDFSWESPYNTPPQEGSPSPAGTEPTKDSK
jgi:hypothetical protein